MFVEQERLMLYNASKTTIRDGRAGSEAFHYNGLELFTMGFVYLMLRARNI